MIGPDPLVLRIPLDGGGVRVYAYPNLDSLVWTAHDSAPPIDHILAFGDEAGSVTAVDTKGRPLRVDLRLGDVTRESSVRLEDVTSTDGWAVYGIDTKGRVRRITPSGNWMFTPPSPARDIFPEPDGALLVLGEAGDSTIIWRVHPPDSTVSDTAVTPHADRALLTTLGDRLYLAVDSALVDLRARGLTPAPGLELKHRVRAIAITPSGDRVYVATDSTHELIVIDRYRNEIATRIPLPGIAAELRMDPTGRYLLVRAAAGDSAWVVALGTNGVAGTVETTWRADLPAVAPDGAIALLHDKDVELVDGGTLAALRTVRRGGADAWLFFAWNGFRPRTNGPDESMAAADSIVEPTYMANTDSSLLDRLPYPEVPMMMPDSTAATVDTLGVPVDTFAAPVQASTFTVQFAAVRSEESAHNVAQDLVLVGLQPRVVSSAVAGVTIYRVVVGPYATRDQAEQVGRAAGKPYWIYEEKP
jgi:DNA-binding beta-propeller fold protein YncE